MKCIVLTLIAFYMSSVHADAFDVEWARFHRDFEALNQIRPIPSSKKNSRKPATQAPLMNQDIKVDEQEGSITDSPFESQLKESDKLGYQITDPKVREKVLGLYRRPDVVVQQYVIPFN